MNVPYIIDRNHQRSVIVVDYSRNFKGIYLMVVTMEQQTEPKQCKSEVEELHIHQNLETGHCM